MGMLFFPLVIVNQFNVERVSAFKSKNDPPVGTDRDCPETFHVTFQRVQMIARDVQALGRSGSVEDRENSLNRWQQVRSYLATVTALVKPLQPAMFKILDRKKSL
jgi:hypothetical protein